MHEHLAIPYHQQDTNYYCGAACAQMVLRALGQPLLPQLDLYNDNHGHTVEHLQFTERGRVHDGADHDHRLRRTVHVIPPTSRNSLAERKGFEPPGLLGLPLSRRMHLSTLPPFRPRGYRPKLGAISDSYHSNGILMP